MRRVRLEPAPRIRIWPAHAVMPVFSSAALTTKSDATKIVAGSPKPARLWFRVSTPVAQSAMAQPMHTATTGSRSQTKRTITPAMMAKTIQMSVKGTSAGTGGRPRHQAHVAQSACQYNCARALFGKRCARLEKFRSPG
jgi:hypothetical protein